jgi:16S rRNA (uracil1498-N3)-methyltransferase
MPQLFIVSQLQKKSNPRTGMQQLFLSNIPDLLAQMRKVLRGKIGDTIFVQSQQGDLVRYEIKITHRTDTDLEGEIIHEQPLIVKSPAVGLLVAMPNKREKAELIVQKLSELGVNAIFFRPAERSVIKQRNEKKAERLMKIAKEATEQSWGVQIPTISWCDEMEEVCENKKVVVFDIPRNVENNSPPSSSLYQDCVGVI